MLKASLQTHRKKNKHLSGLLGFFPLFLQRTSCPLGFFPLAQVFPAMRPNQLVGSGQSFGCSGGLCAPGGVQRVCLRGRRVEATFGGTSRLGCYLQMPSLAGKIKENNHDNLAFLENPCFCLGA